MTKSEPLSPVVFELELAQTDVEETLLLPAGCKAFEIRTNADVKLGFVMDEIAGGNYYTIKNGALFRPPDKMSWSGDLSLAGAAPPAPAAPPPTPDPEPGPETEAEFTLLWGWAFGTFTKEAYDAYVNASNPKFELKPNGRLVSLSQTADFQASSPLSISQGMEAPTCGADGKITFFVKADNTNKHCMFRPTNVAELANRWYLSPRTSYRWRSTIDISTVSDWANITDTIFWQLHPGTYPAGHNQQPPAAITIRGTDDVFRVRLQGNTGNPHAPNWNITPVVQDWAFSTGVHTYQIDWICDPDGSSASFIVKMDAGTGVPTTERMNVTTPFGLRYSGHDTTDAFLNITHGAYALGDLPANFPSIEAHNGYLWRAV